MTWCAKSWFTEWTLANAANWKACSDEFVRFERWETLEGVDLIFVFLLVAALEHRISNSVSVMEFRRQRQECCQSMSWQRCWVCFLSRSCHQGSEVHFNRNGMTGRNWTAHVGDAECQLTTMCVRQIPRNVFKLDVFHRWHYPFHAVRSWWLMICTYVAESYSSTEQVDPSVHKCVWILSGCWFPSRLYIFDRTTFFFVAEQVAMHVVFILQKGYTVSTVWLAFFLVLWL